MKTTRKKAAVKRKAAPSIAKRVANEAARRGAVNWYGR